MIIFTLILAKEKCYSTYREDGCVTCLPHNSIDLCGYCISLNQCSDGTINGPNKLDCPKSDWIFNKTGCTQETCLVSKTIEKCLSPCLWNEKHFLCILPRDLNIETNEEKWQVKIASLTKRIIYFAAILLLLIIIYSLIYSFYYYQNNNYTVLSNQEGILNLDDLPKA